MTAKEVIEIFRESKLFEMMTAKGKQEAIEHASRIVNISLSEEDIKSKVGEVYSG
ncbi:hypothetical protein GW756_06075 [bacterium]|nr:hypothetical protein [bacterium]